MSTIILELGQYVPLPKFCAIWGKMSWGKMSLGHFVLGHFVFWGKMSPSRKNADISAIDNFFDNIAHPYTKVANTIYTPS